MKIMSVGIALSLLFAVSAGEVPGAFAASPAAGAEVAVGKAGQKHQALMQDIIASSPVFRALTRESLSGKWNVRMSAPEGKESAKRLYDQSRAMREGVIAVDIEDGLDAVAATNRLVDAMIDARQVQEGLSPYVLGINPWQAIFGLQPALGAQAYTIKLAVMLELDAAHPDRGLLAALAGRDEPFAKALEAYRADKKGEGAALELPALLSAYKAMLRAENDLSHRRAAEAVAGFTRLCDLDATEEEKGAVHRNIDIQTRPLHLLGTVPGAGDLFALESRQKIWPALADSPIGSEELLKSFGRGMDRWYLQRPEYGPNGVMNEEISRRAAVRAINLLLGGAESIASRFMDMKAENEGYEAPQETPREAPPPRPVEM